MSGALISSGGLELAGGSSSVEGRDGDWECLEVKRYRSDRNYTETVLNYQYRQPLPDSREKDIASAEIQKLQAELCEQKRSTTSLAFGIRTFLQEYSPEQLDGVDENDESPNSAEILLDQLLTFQNSRKLTKETEQLTEMLQDHESKLSEMAKELAEAKMQCDRLGEDNDRLSSVSIKQEELVNRLHSEKDSNIREFSELQKQLLNKTNFVAELEQKLSSMISEKNSLEHEYAGAQRESNQLQQENCRKNEKIEQLTNRLNSFEVVVSNSNNQLQEVCMNLDHTKAENNQLLADIKDLEAWKSASINEMQDLKLKVANLLKNLSVSEEQVRGLTQALKNYQYTVEQSETEIGTLRTDLTQKKQEAVKQQETISRLTQMNENVLNELALKQNEIAALKQKLTSDAEESKKKNEILENLAAKIAEQEDQLKKSQTQMQSLTDQLHTVSQDSDQLKNQLSTAIDEKNTAERSAASNEQTYTNQIHGLLEKNVYTESALLNLNGQNEKLTLENQQLQNDKKSLEAKLDDFMTQVQQKDEAVKESSEVCKQHLLELATIKHEFEILLAKHSEVVKEQKNLEGVAAGLGEQINQMANTFDKAVEEMETEKAQLEASIWDEKAKNAKLELEIAEQDKQMEQQKQDLDDMGISLKEKTEELQCSVYDRANLQNIYKTALSSMEQQALLYEERIATAVQKIETLQMDLKMAEAVRNELEKKLNTAAEELSRSEKERNNLKENVQDLENKLQHQTDVIVTSKETIQSLRTDVDQLLAEKESSIAEKTILEENLAELKQMLEDALQADTQVTQSSSSIHESEWINGKTLEKIHRRLEHMEQKLCTPISLTCHVSTLKANVPLPVTSFFSQPSAPQ